MARVQEQSQTAWSALQANSHPLVPLAVNHQAAQPTQTRRRTVSFACATQGILGRTMEHAKLAALGRTRTRLAPAPALHARQANIPRGAPSASCPCLDQSHKRIEQKLLELELA